jgi:hypothetical protein
VSPTGPFFFFFNKKVFMTGSSNTDRFTVSTTIGQSRNNSNFLDLILGINGYYIYNTIPGIYIDYKLIITDTSITVILLTELFTTDFKDSYLHFNGMFLLLPKDAPYSKQRFTQTPWETLYGPNGAIISKEYQINVKLTS